MFEYTKETIAKFDERQEAIDKKHGRNLEDYLEFDQIEWVSTDPEQAIYLNEYFSDTIANMLDAFDITLPDFVEAKTYGHEWHGMPLENIDMEDLFDAVRAQQDQIWCTNVDVENNR